MFSSQNQFLQNVILVGFSYRLSELFKLLYIGHNSKSKPLLLLWSTDIFTLVTHTVRPIIHILLFTVYPYTHRFNAARLLLCCCFVRLLFYQKQFKKLFEIILIHCCCFSEFLFINIIIAIIIIIVHLGVWHRPFGGYLRFRDKGYKKHNVWCTLI